MWTSHASIGPRLLHHHLVWWATADTADTTAYTADTTANTWLGVVAVILSLHQLYLLSALFSVFCSRLKIKISINSAIN